MKRPEIPAVMRPQIDQGVGRGIVLGARLLAGLALQDRSEYRPAWGGVRQAVQRLERPALELAVQRRPHGGGHVSLFHHRVHQTHASRLGRAQGASGEHQRQGLNRADQTHRARRPAQAWVQAQLHLRKAELRARQGDAVSAGERYLQPAAERVTVHHGHGGEGQGLQSIEHGVKFGQFRRHQIGVADPAELGDVGPDHEARALGRAQHQPLGRVGFQSGQDVVQRRQHTRVDAVGGQVRLVEHQPGDSIRPPHQAPAGRTRLGHGPAELQPVAVDLAPDAHGQTASTSMDPPWPPPMHWVAMASLPPRCFRA